MSGSISSFLCRGWVFCCRYKIKKMRVADHKAFLRRMPNFTVPQKCNNAKNFYNLVPCKNTPPLFRHLFFKKIIVNVIPLHSQELSLKKRLNLFHPLSSKEKNPLDWHGTRRWLLPPPFRYNTRTHINWAPPPPMYIEATVGWVTLTPGAAGFNREDVCTVHRAWVRCCFYFY